jgi:two-component system response regulator MprA
MSAEARRQTVLVIDDDREVRESLRTLLQLDGYKVKTARDGQGALEQLRGGLRPSIILLDLMMPAMDGQHFRAEQLRDPEFAHIPVVVLSGHYDPQQNAASLGAVASLRKPADIDTVLQLIEAHRVRQHESAPSCRPAAPVRPAAKDS